MWSLTLPSILLVLPLRVTGAEPNLNVEAQAHNGLRLWLRHFDRVTLACLRVAKSREPELPMSTIEGADRLAFVGLPETWQPHKFFAKLPVVSKVLGAEIDRADYLQFGIGGLWGDWPSVAALIAARKQRPFAVWTDRVESNAHHMRAKNKRGVARAYATATASLMGPYERTIIRKADLGLFHGADCYNAYSKHCKSSHLVHDIHIDIDKHISEADLQHRLNARSGPLRIAYVGKAEPEKGTIDWVRAIASASQSAEIEATWFGVGSDLSEAQQLASTLDAPIRFPGRIPHSELIDTLKTFDAFVFCHKTLESPRCLIEALACGLPIVGYHSQYPADLLKDHEGGLLVEKDDLDSLASAIVCLSNVGKLRALSVEARLAAAELTDERVFAHRSRLILGMKSRSRNVVH